MAASVLPKLLNDHFISAPAVANMPSRYLLARINVKKCRRRQLMMVMSQHNLERNARASHQKKYRSDAGGFHWRQACCPSVHLERRRIGEPSTAAPKCGWAGARR
jgi:hypothetical protein